MGSNLTVGKPGRHYLEQVIEVSITSKKTHKTPRAGYTEKDTTTLLCCRWKSAQPQLITTQHQTMQIEGLFIK